VKPRALLARISQGSLRNIRFEDLVRLAQALGFRAARTEGSHRVFTHPEVAELLNLQEVEGEAKPYQARQLLRLIERYNLRLKAEP
jgi:predicted RNA binding protein YcfA (HicA-like mRNA interferase family)